MKFPRRQFLRLAAGAAALPAVSRIAWAQAYPTKPVRAPGGGTDVTAADDACRVKQAHC
jgi:tripartite-type tricarboxylate transporter receptor subunit TctC